MKYKFSRICFLCAVFIFLTACSTKETKISSTYQLTEKQVNNLMLQYVENKECFYDEYLPSTWVASCKIFGAERLKDSDIGYVYAYVLDVEYVKFKDAAYEQSGGLIPVKITVKFDDDHIEYVNCEYPEDGDAYQASLQKMFPSKYYKMCERYNPYDENGNVKLEKNQEAKIKELWGCGISKEIRLDISEDGSYELIQSGENESGEFEVQVKEKGRLEKLAATE